MRSERNRPRSRERIRSVRSMCGWAADSEMKGAFEAGRKDEMRMDGLLPACQ